MTDAQMKTHTLWREIIVAAASCAVALIAAYAFSPQVTPYYGLNMSRGKWKLEPSTGIPVEKINLREEKDTSSRFARRLILGGVIGALVGFTFCDDIIRKFKDDFTLL